MQVNTNYTKIKVDTPINNIYVLGTYDTRNELKLNYYKNVRNSKSIIYRYSR